MTREGYEKAEGIMKEITDCEVALQKLPYIVIGERCRIHWGDSGRLDIPDDFRQSLREVLIDMFQKRLDKFEKELEAL